MSVHSYLVENTLSPLLTLSLSLKLIFTLIFHRRLWEESIEENQVDDGERSTQPGNDNNDDDH